MKAVPRLADRQEFLDAMRRHADADVEELERLSALWPAAHEAAAACLVAMPSIGFLSLKRREAAFLTVAEVLDARVHAGALDQEQAQLALTVLRIGSRRYRKAEAAFVARLGRRDPEAIGSLPRTALFFLRALRVMRERAAAAGATT